MAITTSLEGAGGFGKTMLAHMVCADERIRQHFDNRIYFVTIGRDVREPAAIALKVADAIRFITGHTVTYTDPGMAGDELGRLLDEHPSRGTLLVLDDIWEHGQLDPFLRGGARCVRLVTTRVPVILPEDAERIRVDRMTRDQAHNVLCQDLPPLSEHSANELIAATGGWPLLLRLANRWIAEQLSAGADPEVAAEQLLALLKAKGPAGTDDPSQPVDLGDPQQRSTLVRATMQAATGLLTDTEQQHLAELGIFAEDEAVPVPVAGKLWQATGGLDVPQSRRLCMKLDRLSLLTVSSNEGGFLLLHDVIRDYLRHELGSGQITEANAVLTDVIQTTLPVAASLTTVPTSNPQAAWWTLAGRSDSTPADRYLSDHAISHLVAAGRAEQAEAVACDLRWVEARVRQHGPIAPWSDCIQIPTAQAARRARDLAQVAHLLGPTDPVHALTAILFSRLGPLLGWNDQVAALQRQIADPTLINRWDPPDLPDTALIRAIVTRHPAVAELAVVPDSTWLATVGAGGNVQIWDAVTGRETCAFAFPAGRATAFAVAPDGSWLAGASEGTARIWNPATGQLIHAFTCPSRITTMAVAPDSTWLATGDADGMVRIWDLATGQQTRTLPGYDSTLPSGSKPRALAVAPDGAWIAVVSGDGWTVRIWEPASGDEIGALADYDSTVTALVVGPDGTWLATSHSGIDVMVRIWDPATSQQICSLTDGPLPRALAVVPEATWLALAAFGGTIRSGSSQITHTVEGDVGARALAVAPDGAWLATAASEGDGTVRIWDPATGQQTHAFAGHTGMVGALGVAPDGTWIATASDSDETVRIWNPATGQPTRALPGNGGGVRMLAVAPDGTWIATASGRDGTVRIWDPATDQHADALVGPGGGASVLAVAPDGTWIATTTSGSDGTVRILDLATSEQIRTLTGHTSQVTTMVVAPDGTWIATGDYEGSVRISKLAVGGRTRASTGHSGWAATMAVAANGGMIATSRDGDDGDAIIREHHGSSEWQSGAYIGHHGVSALASAPDGTCLAVGYGDGEVQICDRVSGRQTHSLAGHSGGVSALAFAPDNTWIATVGYSDGTVRIWDPVTGQLTQTLTARDNQKTLRMVVIGRGVSLLAVAPDGTWLATAGLSDGTVRIWDPVTGQQTQTLTPGDNQKTPSMVAHGHGVGALAIAPDGTWIATAGMDDGTVRIWDPTTGQETDALTGHGNGLYGLAVAPDCSKLAVACHSDCTIRIWDLIAGRVVAMMRSEKPGLCCAWTPDGASLVVLSEAGAHTYDFHPGA